MYVPFRRLSEGIKFLLIFIVCTLLFYNAITIITHVIKPKDPYKEPEGRAMKVLKYGSVENVSYEDFKRRVFDFYWYGE